MAEAAAVKIVCLVGDQMAACQTGAAITMRLTKMARQREAAAIGKQDRKAKMDLFHP